MVSLELYKNKLYILNYRTAVSESLYLQLIHPFRTSYVYPKALLGLGLGLGCISGGVSGMTVGLGTNEATGERVGVGGRMVGE